MAKYSSRFLVGKPSGLRAVAAKLASILPSRPRKLKTKRRKVLGTLENGTPIFPDKWYLLHARGGFTGTFDSREEAAADHRSADSEVLTSKEILARLTERNKTA